MALHIELVAAAVIFLEEKQLDRLMEIIKRHPRRRVERMDEFLLREVGMEKLLEWHSCYLAECRKAKGAS